MAEIVDAFVATLSLDDADYKKKSREYRDDRKRLAEEEQKQNRISQDGQSRTVAGLRTLRNETAGFLLMLAGATSVLGFAKDLMTADAATGRFAKNVGMSTERVSVWENALKRVGGSAGEARQALGTLFGIFQAHRLGIDNSKGSILAFFGLSEKDLQNPEAALLHIAEVIKKMPRENVETQLGLLGLSGSIVGLLAGDRGELTKLLASVESMGVATDESAEAAMSLEAEMAATAQGLKDLARPAVSELAGAFTELLGVVNDLIAPFGEVRDFFNALADSNLFKLLVAAPDAKTIWDYIGEAMPENEGAQVLRKRWGNPGSRGGGGGGSGMIGGALGMFLDVQGMMGGGAPAGGTGGALTLNSLRGHFVQQESRGNYAARNRETGAMGAYQVMPATGRVLARRLGMGWRPDLMTSTSAEGRQYQDAIGGAAIQEAIDHGGGDLSTIAQYYHGGSNRRIWGPRTRQYARDMAGRVYGGSRGVPDAARSAGRRGPGGSMASSGGGNQTNSTTIGQIVVNTQATDAAGITRDIRGEMVKRIPLVQAGGGLRP